MNLDALYAKSKVQLERDEGRRNKIYRDSEGIETIGVGINLQIGLTNEEVDLLFQHRWKKTLSELLTNLPWAADLDEARLGALQNMAFNLGLPRLKGFVKLLDALKHRRWEEARKQALDSTWATQVGARSLRLATTFETGEWK